MRRNGTETARSRDRSAQPCERAEAARPRDRYRPDPPARATDRRRGSRLHRASRPERAERPHPTTERNRNRPLARSLASVAGRGPTRAGGNGGNARPVRTGSARSRDGREARITIAPRLPFPSGRKWRERAAERDGPCPLGRRTPGGRQREPRLPSGAPRAGGDGRTARSLLTGSARSRDGREARADAAPRLLSVGRAEHTRAGGNSGKASPDGTDPPARVTDARRGAGPTRAPHLAGQATRLGTFSG